MSESSFDLSKFLPDNGSTSIKTAKGSKRPYTVIAQAGASSLAVNLSIEPMAYPGAKSGGCLAVMVRGMETPSPHSEAGSKFPAWGYRDLGGEYGARTHKRAFPIIELPAMPQQLLAAWTDGEFDKLVCTRIQGLLAQDGHEPLNGIDGLLLIAEALVQPLLDIKQPKVLDGKEIVSAD